MHKFLSFYQLYGCLELVLQAHKPHRIKRVNEGDSPAIEPMTFRNMSAHSTRRGK
jgi:hypothetical protein